MSEAMQWGAPIQIDGKRPDWLRQGERFTCGCHPDKGNLSRRLRFLDWRTLPSIRLPVGHAYYLAISKGYTYWPGGDAAPADADLMGGALMRHGTEMHGDVSSCRWDNAISPSDIIGYRKIASPADEIDQLRKEAEALRQHAGLTADFNPSGFSARVSRVVGRLMKENDRLTKTLQAESARTNARDSENAVLAASVTEMQERIAEAVRRSESYGTEPDSIGYFIRSPLLKYIPASVPEPDQVWTYKGKDYFILKVDHKERIQFNDEWYSTVTYRLEPDGPEGLTFRRALPDFEGKFVRKIGEGA